MLREKISWMDLQTMLMLGQIEYFNTELIEGVGEVATVLKDDGDTVEYLVEDE